MSHSSVRWSAAAACGMIGALASLPAWADRNSEIEATLREFSLHPATVMNQQIVKRDQNGAIVRETESPFSADDILNRNFIVDRDHQRQLVCKEINGARVCLSQVLPGRAPIETNDQVEDLVDNGATALRTLEQMEAKHLASAKLPEAPWSDTYWPIYQGITAARYADPSFPSDQDWKANRDYTTGADNTAAAFVHAENASSIDTLSPAEKYDLLVGDENMTLTKAMWSEGEQYYNANGSVETWMGICHGWSPAAFMIARPTGTITVTAADGHTKISFYPSDIKGLSSLLWAKAEAPSNFIGGRCNDKNPAMDANGRITSQDCFDTNPGTWHMSIVNQIGVSKRGMVMDATYDYEVWNQPVYSYSYTYFNPQTNAAAATLADAKIDLANYANDKFKQYRSHDAKSVVGVAMDVTYVVETRPTHNRTDSATRDAHRTARYLYDLELDSTGKIIGGEWYQNAHPDFLWTPPKGTHAGSSAERFATGAWTGEGAMPDAWQKAAARASGYSQPLAKVVDTLVIMSRAAR